MAARAGSNLAARRVTQQQLLAARAKWPHLEWDSIFPVRPMTTDRNVSIAHALSHVPRMEEVLGSLVSQNLLVLRELYEFSLYREWKVLRQWLVHSQTKRRIIPMMYCDSCVYKACDYVYVSTSSLQPMIEQLWAMKAIKYAETHMKVHTLSHVCLCGTCNNGFGFSC